MGTLEVGVTKAVDWIAEQLRERPAADRFALIDQASQRFGLSPLQAEFPYRQFLRREGEAPREEKPAEDTT